VVTTMSLLGRPEPIMPLPWAKACGLLAIGALAGQYPYRLAEAAPESVATYVAGYALLVLLTAAACAGVGLLLDLGVAQVRRWRERRAEQQATNVDIDWGGF
jgi:hypothetical protein